MKKYDLDYVTSRANQHESGSIFAVSCPDVRQLIAERAELLAALEGMLNMLDPDKLQKMADASNYSVELFLFAREQAEEVITKVKK